MAPYNRYSYPAQRSHQSSYHPAPSYTAARGPPPAPRQQFAAPNDGWSSPVHGGYSSGGNFQYYPSPAPSYHESVTRPPRDAYRAPLPPARNDVGGSGQAPPSRWSNGYADEPYYSPTQPRPLLRRMSAERYPPSQVTPAFPPNARQRPYRDLDVSPEAVKVNYILKPSPAPQLQPPPPPLIYDYGNLSTSIIYCCRPINHHAFMALQSSNYPHLELHFVPSLVELEAEVRDADLLAPAAPSVRRKCFVTPVGGSDEYVAQVRKEMQGVPLYWRQAITVEMLEEELEKDEAFVASKESNQQPTSALSRWQNPHEAAETSKSARRRRTVELAPVAEKAELRAIGRHETDDSSSTVLALEAAAAGMDCEAGEIFDSTTSAKAVSESGQQEEDFTASPASSRKRSRKDSEGSSKLSSRRESGEGAQQAHKAAKALEYACKKPRRSCNDWALKNGVPIDEATRKADDEPVLGERHRGIWNLYGEESLRGCASIQYLWCGSADLLVFRHCFQPLGHIPPQIQVLMARVLRDAAQPTRLQLYEHPEAHQQLAQAVPWFLALLDPLKNNPEVVLPVAQTKSTTAADIEAWVREPLPPQLSDPGHDVKDLSL